MRQRGWWQAAALVLGALGASPSSLRAQLAPVGVPKGLLRFDFGGDLTSYDLRYHGGVREEFAADYASPALGSDVIAGLEAFDASIGQAIGNSGYRLNLGKSSGSALVSIGAYHIGLGLGLTSRLSIFASAPIVRYRVQPDIRFDSAGGQAGLNPLAGLPCSPGSFCGDFQSALTTLSNNITGGVYDANPTTKALAVSTLTTGTALLNLLSSADSASPFLPIDTTAGGAGLKTAVTSLQATLTTLGISGFSQAITLPTARLTPQDFEDFLTNPGGLVAARPFQDAKLSRLGDITVGAIYTLVDRWDRGGGEGGFRAALRGTVLLPTGLVARNNDFFGLRSGEGRTEVSVGLTTDLGHGLLGARLDGSYTLRLAANRTVRVSLPTQPIALLSRLADVKVNPGDVLALSARPYLRVSRAIAVVGGVGYWRRGVDQATLAGSGTVGAGINAADLVLDSKASAFTLSGGVTYASASLRHPERPGLPVEASWSYETVVKATGGRVPAERMSTVEIRFYHRLFNR